MANLKEKYSDPELDRSNKAFEEIVGRPDMQALDDQGDAIARDLDVSENSPENPSSLGKNSDRNSVAKAENDNSTTPDNRFNYENKTKQKRTSKSSSWSRRKKLIVGGSVGGGIIGLITSLMLLLPMKVPGLMQLITDKAGQRLEQVTEERAKLILGRAILTKFGTHTGIVLTGDGAFKTLVVSMRTSSFEKRLAAKGLVIEKTPSGVKLIFNGEKVDNGREFKNEKAIVDALESNKLTNKMLKNVIKEDIPSWRWMKRAKFAKWLRIKYGIPRYGLTQSDKDTPEERAKDYDKQRVDAANKRTMGNFSSLIKCLMSGSCDKVDGQGEPSKASQTDAQGEPLDTAGKAADERLATVSAKGLKGLTSKFSEVILKVFASKGLPIIGWIDIVATLDNIAYKTGHDDYFGKLVAYYRGAAYAAIYAEWAGYGSQIQLGEMEPSYVGQLASELDGAEQAITFQTYENNYGKGIPVEVTVDSSKPSEVSKAFKTYTESDMGLGYRYVFHPVMHAYYETVGGGGLLGWMSGVIGNAIGKFLGPVLLDPITKIVGAITPESLKDMARNMVIKSIPYILKFFGLTIDSFERSAKLFNNIVGGAEVSTNQYCKEIGCRLLTDEQVGVQNRLIAEEKAEYRAQQGLAYTLFSREEPSSLSSQIVYKMPASPSATVATIGSLVASAPTKLFGFMTPKLHAAEQSNANLFNIAMYGATSADLNKPLSQAFLNGGNDGEGCPKVAEGEFDDCKIDTTVAEAMQCEFDPESADCSDTDPSTPLEGGDGSFTVASYNILHATSHTDNSIDIGGCKQKPVPGDPTCAKTRASRQAQIITGKGEGVNNPAFDLVATQETSPDQYQALKGLLPDYDVLPEDPSRLSNSEDGAVAMFWNKSKFTRFESGKTPGISNTSKDITSPWVGLKMASGQKVYFMSIHYANSHFGGTAESIRKSSELTMNWVRSKAVDTNIVIVAGDFNDTLQQKLSYCVYTKDSLMQHAVDMAAGASPKEGCSKVRFRGIDHIYATPIDGLSAANWRHAPDTGIYAQSSDHTPVYVTYSLPASNGNAVVGDWSWPVDKKWWQSDRADFLGAHPGTGTAWGGDNMGTADKGAGIAADIGNPPDGSPVYAMLGGTVTSTNLCGAGDGIAIKSKVGNDTIGISYMHGTDKKFKVGDTVKSGQRIMSLGTLGCNVYGGHVHIGIAYNGKYVCPQDIFLAMGAGTEPDLTALTKKAVAPCGR